MRVRLLWDLQKIEEGTSKGTWGDSGECHWFRGRRKSS